MCQQQPQQEQEQATSGLEVETMADSQRKTANIYDKYHTIELTNLGTRYGRYVDKGTYSIYNDTNNIVYWFANDGYSRFRACEPHSTATVSLTEDYNNVGFYMAYNDDSLGDVSIVQGSTAPDHYIPYWQHSLRKLTTATDTITTLPADLYADGNNATVGLVGNMVQSGTPTPQNPIQPQETGERTENLFDGSTSATNQRLSTSGTGTYAAQGYSVSSFIEIEPSTYYRLTTGETSYYNLYNENKQYIYGAATNTRIPDSYANARYVRFDFKTENIPSVMIVKDSTATSSYIPYGYKIPISSANTTTPVYLGEVETMRKIKQYEVTGQENWYGYSTTVSGKGASLQITDMLTNGRENGYCSHFIAQYSPNQSSIDGVTFGVNNNSIYITFSTATATALNLTDTQSIKDYLAQQYAAGTPVTVWYVLAEPTTGIVNEPLRKIGDYADTVSGITIPTITGKDTVDVQTTLKPSEVSLSYTGWHDATVKEWDGSQWQ